MRSLVVLPLALAIAACGDNGNGSNPDGNGGDDAPGDPDAQPDAGPPPGDPTTGTWVDSFALPGLSGFGSRVEDVAIAADGSVYAAGIFQDAAGLPVRNVARWTGTDWDPLGAGLDGWVRAIAFDADGVLWAAATSEDVTTGTLARWDGAAWTTANTLDGAIRDMAIVATGVVVVGDFTGSVRVLDPDADTWQDVTPRGISGAASAVARNGAGFCVAGSFDSIDGVAAENAACWSATGWTRLGSGLPGGVAVLVRQPGGSWYAGGTLTFVVDPTTGEYEAGIARLQSGVWRPFQGGIDNGFINEVRAIAFDGTDVLVGGHFQTAGRADVPVSHLARYTPGSGWSEVGGGLINDVGVFLPSIIGTGDIEVAADGTLWVGGLHTRAGNVPAVNIARLPAAGAATALVGPRPVLGLGGFADTIAAADGGGVLVGGGIAFGGQTRVDGLGLLRDGTWTDLGAGLRGIVREVLPLPGGRYAIAGELLVGGSPVAFAEWDGAGWQLPGGALEGAGFALAQDASGAIWVGGDLVMAGTTPVSNLARLSGGAWSSGGAFDQRVSSLAVQGDAIIAGGLFTTVDGAPASAIAIRDAAGTWSELGGGIDGDFAYVNAVAVSPALGIVVGGSFPGVGGVAAVDLARWDGSTWHDLSTGFAEEDFGFVSALLPYGNGLFLAGGFATLGGAPASNLGWFDGTSWHALGAGLADLAEDMVVVDDVLWIGGPFTAAGGRPASGIAVWDFRASR